MVADKIKDLVIKINDEDCTKLYDYLVNTDFFECPASSRYHHSYDGGLAIHCSEVFINLGKLETITTSEKIPIKDKFLLAFGHDLSKVHFYKKAEKWTKENGKWITIPGYDVEKPEYYLGHETGSVFSLKSIVPNVSDKVIQAIAFHHGAFNQSTMSEYSEACRENDYVLTLHTADMMSCIEDDKKER